MLDAIPPANKHRVARLPWLNALSLAAVVVGASLIAVKNLRGDVPAQILNVSYDPTRELYGALDRQFVSAYQKQTGIRVNIDRSHGGSSRQTASVIDGSQKATVVSLALPSDVEAIARHGLVAPNWRARLPYDAVPYTSTIVFVVRKDNPKAIHDWPDLVKDGVAVVTPDPRTSGNGKLSVLAAYGSVTTRGGDHGQAVDFLKALFRHATALAPGARDAATSFAIERVGDVHLTWENEALREVAANRDELQLVYPPVSIRAEPSVAWVDANIKDAETASHAKAYLEWLFSDAAQETIGQNGYRPSKPAIAARYEAKLGPVKLFPITAIAKDWDDARGKFFADGGIVDVIAPPRKD